MLHARSLAEDLVLVGLDPTGRGRVRIGAWPDVLVESAIIVDLVRAGRVAVSGTGLEVRVSVTDARPVEQPVLRDALRWMEKVHGPPSATDLAELGAAGWLTRKVVGLAWDPTTSGAKLTEVLRGYVARRRVLEHLVSTGAITAREHRILGIKRTQRYAVTPLAQRDQLLDDLRAVLLDGREPDERTGPLLGLLGTANVFRSTGHGAPHLARWVPRQRRHEVDDRARQLADGDVEGVREVVAATRAIIVKRNQTSS